MRYLLLLTFKYCINSSGISYGTACQRMLWMLKLAMDPKSIWTYSWKKINWEPLNTKKDSSSDSGNPWTTGSAGREGKRHGLICVHLARLHLLSFPKQGGLVHHYQLGKASGWVTSVLSTIWRSWPGPNLSQGSVKSHVLGNFGQRLRQHLSSHQCTGAGVAEMPQSAFKGGCGRYLKKASC